MQGVAAQSHRPHRLRHFFYRVLILESRSTQAIRQFLAHQKIQRPRTGQFHPLFFFSPGKVHDFSSRQSHSRANLSQTLQIPIHPGSQIYPQDKVLAPESIPFQSNDLHRRQRLLINTLRITKIRS